MPTLKINPPKPPPDRNSSSSPSQESNTAPSAGTFTFSAPPPASIPHNAFAPAINSPVAPEYSPITPKVQPVLPASAQNDATMVIPPDTSAQPASSAQSAPTAIAPAQFVPQPRPRPFSSEDSEDAIALRAAISALQFQKKRARDDLRTLEATKRDALDNQQHFRDELVAGRVREPRPQFGGMQAVLARADSNDDNDDDDEEDEQDVVLGADESGAQDSAAGSVTRPAKIPDSQPSPPGTSSANSPSPQPNKLPDFTRIPGPQDIVRMPHINWKKYHIVGEALDQMHEQQRRWPGSNFAYGQKRGREFAVAAPYSPFQDVLNDGEEARKDSAAAASSALQTPTGTVSEHPMETRRSSKNQQP